MLSLKFVAVVLLIGAVSPSQATPELSSLPSSIGLVGGLENNVFGAVGGLTSLLGKYHGGKDNTVGILKILLGHVLHLDIPKTVDDLAELICQLGIVLQKLLDGILPPLGTALWKILAALSQIVLCNLGSAGETGKLFGVKDSPTAKLCSAGFFSASGLKGDIDCDTAKQVMSEGCDEGNKVWGKLKDDHETKGLIGVLLDNIKNLLDLGSKCQDPDYDVGGKDLMSGLTNVGTFYTSCNKHYNLVDGLLEHINQLLKSLFGEQGFDSSAISSQTAKCGQNKSSGLENLGSCFDAK